MTTSGWKASEMLTGMDGVIQLAAASGEDLASVSDIVTDNLTAFGLTAADTAHFSDVLAAAATNSNTSVAIMGETFKNSASVAGALGYSIEDVATAVGIMANSGVKGSRAGTALKNIFSGLASGVTLTCEALGDYEFSAVKSDGTMKSFADTMDELRGVFAEMTEQEKLSNAINIAGSRTFNGLLALINATDAEYSELAATIGDCTGAAQTMASIKLDNLNGDLTLMQSAWDALKTSIGEEFIPVMRDVYGIGTDVFNLANDFVKENPEIVAAIAGAAGVLGVLTAAVAAFNAVATAAKALGVAGAFAAAGPIMLTAAAIGALTAYCIEANAEMMKNVESVEELTEAAAALRDTLDGGADTLRDTEAETLATATAAERYAERLSALAAAEEKSDEAGSEWQTTLALLVQTVPEAADAISSAEDEYGRTIYTLNTTTAALRENIEAWKAAATESAYYERYTALAEDYAAAMVGQQEAAIKQQKALDELTAAQAAYNAAQAETAAAQARGEWNLRSYRDAELETGDALIAAQAQYDNCTEAIGDYDDVLADAEAALEAYGALLGALPDENADAADSYDDLCTATDEYAQKLLSLEETYRELKDTALDSIQSQFDLWDSAEITETGISTLIANAESQRDYWNSYTENMAYLRSIADETPGLIALLNETDLSTEGVAVVAGIAAAARSGDADSIERLVALYAEQGAAENAAADQSAGAAAQAAEMQAEADAILEEYAGIVDGLDMSDEAYFASVALWDAMIDAADDMRSEVAAAYAQSGSEAVAALAGNWSYPAAFAQTGTDAETELDAGYTVQRLQETKLTRAEYAAGYSSIERVLGAGETAQAAQQMLTDAYVNAGTGSGTLRTGSTVNPTGYGVILGQRYEGGATETALLAQREALVNEWAAAYAEVTEAIADGGEMGDEAYATARETAEQMIAAAEDMRGDEADAFRALGAELIAQLVAGLKLGVSTAGKTVTTDAHGNTFITSADYSADTYFAGDHDGYAGGTGAATAGVHLVGENGPELLLFHGGESVINTQETQKLLERAREVRETMASAGIAPTQTDGIFSASTLYTMQSADTYLAGDADGYADGTGAATAGVHLVGENGPELLLFHGGESVINTQETQKLLERAREVRETMASAGIAPTQTDGIFSASTLYTMQSADTYLAGDADGYAGGTTAETAISYGGSYSGGIVEVQFAPQYTFSGSGAADAAETETMLRAHDAEVMHDLAALIEEILEARATAARRRAYV
ncbi:MAG: phage tail tape measure protein [Oscillospiraceae bacterium]|nr:phage tail tape measure protein [Oscillospiraceae bacterium]